MTNQEKGIEFEKECYKKLKDLGFSDLSLTKATDNGADILGFYNQTKYVFQCKNHSKTQGNRCVQEVVAAQKLYKANRSVVISKSDFSSAAISLANANNCILIKAIDFFNLELFPPKNYSAIFHDNRVYADFDYNILEAYEEEKRNLKRTPKWAELNKHLRYLITKKYKNYGNFLLVIGDNKHTSKHTDDELKVEYKRIKNLLHKTPTLSDIKENSDFPLNAFHAYPFTKLQKECGDRPNIERGISKEELIRAYFELEKKLKRTPSINEIEEKGEYRASYYRRKWGSFDNFLLEIGRTRVQANLPKKFSNEEIVIIYWIIKNLLSIIKEDSNITVTHTILEKLSFDGKTIISPGTISKKFGSWEKFKKYYDKTDENTIIEWLKETTKKY